MSGVLILLEHRKGEIREISYEMLGKGRILAEALNVDLQTAVLASEVGPLTEKIKKYASTVFTVEDNQLDNYNPMAYQAVLNTLLKEY
ncbi:MAG: electron transfer flavoprotein subunit alpha, partial [Pseudomonadota bacterium]